MRKLFTVLTFITVLVGCDAHKDVDVDVETKTKCFERARGSHRIYDGCVKSEGYILVFSRLDGGYIYAKKAKKLH